MSTDVWKQAQEQRSKEELLNQELRKQRQRDAIWQERVARSERIVLRLADLRGLIVVLSSVAVGVVGLVIGVVMTSLIVDAETLVMLLVGLAFGLIFSVTLGKIVGNLLAVGVDWMASVLELLMSE